ncbi:MAG TPA: flavin reductase family protein [Candidatus Dormibacteraeota bacterium]
MAEPSPALPAERYREIMASFPSGVVVLTALAADGSPHGLTVSAFSPVSLAPPLVLACVDRGSNTLPFVRETGYFTINILAAGQQQLARTMATKDPRKFEDLEWAPPPVPGCGPVLEPYSAAFACCSIDREIEAGDHVIFVGRVLAGDVYAGRTPLVYHRRAFLELGG